MTRAGLLMATLVVCVTAVVIARSNAGPAQRELVVTLDRAYGLENGSAVMIGGVRRGSTELAIAKDDRIRVTLRLDADAPAVARNTRVRITAANLLGQKRVEIEAPRRPLGEIAGRYEVRGGNVSVPTDLDEVLAVFDLDTRTRAMILLNELGTSVLGRRAAIRTLLAELPGGMSQATRVAAELEADNERLRTLVVHARGFVTTAAARRRDLGELIAAAADAATPLADRRADLDASLAEAPRTLRAARAFLADLQATAQPLGRTARDLIASAGPLRSALGQIEPFTVSASPTLAAVTEAAPTLGRLGRQATPDLRRVLPAVSGLRRLSTSLTPVSRTLDRSSNNILAILENWARAIQFRDSLGHVFRGEASFTPDAIRSAIDRLLGPESRRKARPTARGKRPASPRKPTRIAPSGPNLRAPEPPKLDVPAVQGLGDDLEKTVDGLLGKRGNGGGRSDLASALLDYLLMP